MSPMPDDLHADARHQLTILVRRRKNRFVSKNKNRPCKWFPTKVWNPATQQWFTQAGAWEIVADKLEEGEKLSAITLEHPPGRVGYVMVFRLAEGQPLIYVKLELGSGNVFGRSFHYSDTEDNLGGE